MLRRLFKRVFSSPFRPLYDEARLLPKLRRSILFVIFGNVFGNLFGVITGVGGTALTGYAEALGAGDFVFGVLNGIPLAAALMQIPASMLVSRGHRRKRYMLTYGVFSRALWIVVGLVPFFTPIQPAWLRLWGVIFLVGISSVTGAFINVCFTPWLADLVPLRIRGRWISLRDGIIAAANVLVGLVTAFLLDNIPRLPRLRGGVRAGRRARRAGHVLLPLCGRGLHPSAHAHQAVQVQPQIFQDKPFFRFMLFWTAWSFTANLSSPFLGRYALSMGLSYMQLTLCGQIASALTTVSVVWLWGRLLDQYGSKPVLWVSCLLAALTPAFYLFSTPNNIWPTLLYNVIGAFFWSAANPHLHQHAAFHHPGRPAPGVHRHVLLLHLHARLLPGGAQRRRAAGMGPRAGGLRPARLFGAHGGRLQAGVPAVGGDKGRHRAAVRAAHGKPAGLQRRRHAARRAPEHRPAPTADQAQAQAALSFPPFRSFARPWRLWQGRASFCLSTGAPHAHSFRAFDANWP